MSIELSKTKVLTVRVEEGLYRKLQEDSQEVGGVAQYVREILYTFLYSSVKVNELHEVLTLKSSKTSTILKQVEERQEELEKSIENSRKNVKHLEELNSSILEFMNSLNEMVKEGIEEIPMGGQGEK